MQDCRYGVTLKHKLDAFDRNAARTGLDAVGHKCCDVLPEMKHIQTVRPLQIPNERMIGYDDLQGWRCTVIGHD
ncbi:hypothetical protein [Rhizobium rhizogenes]|uniref:hypothetical protein n=2 Tax=Rhizobium/Agrobacterium group TaxID=227290 RepID=UPI001386F069|nr:hypothetical protein [Rhizobium rhizogenes]